MKTVNVNIDCKPSTSTYFIFRAKDTLPTKELFIRYKNLTEGEVNKIKNNFLENKYTIGTESKMYELTKIEHNTNTNICMGIKGEETIIKTTIEGSVVKIEDNILFSRLPEFGQALSDILKNDKEKRIRVTIEEIKND